MKLTGKGHLFAPVRSHPIDAAPQVQFIGTKEGLELLPQARVVVIVEDISDRSVMMYRFAEDGAFGGDTWHQNVEDAQHQADFEYGSYLGEWRTFPEDAADVFEYDPAPLADYALRMLKK